MLAQEIRTLVKSLENTDGTPERLLLKKLKLFGNVFYFPSDPERHKTSAEFAGRRGKATSGVHRKQQILRRLEEDESNDWRTLTDD